MVVAAVVGVVEIETVLSAAKTKRTDVRLIVSVMYYHVTKLRTAQRAMERKMLDLKLKDKIPCSEIRKRTKIIDIIEYTLKQKWKWAGHIARLEDNRWTKRCTEWQPRRVKRSRGRHKQKMARRHNREGGNHLD